MTEKTIWQINVDRYGDESRAKGGKLFSVGETADLLIELYRQQMVKPEIHVVAIGFGLGLSDYLEYKEIPHKRIKGSIVRIGSADLIKYRREEK